MKRELTIFKQTIITREIGKFVLCCAGLLWVSSAQAAQTASAEVRVAVVGGLAMSGVWPELAKRAEAATGLHIVTVAAAPKEGVVPPFAKGDAELLLIHGSDETYQLQAQGLAAPLRAWAQNEHVIVGPADDPAKVGEAHDGIDAIRRISAADAPLIGFRDPGSFSTMQHLWRAAGLRPGPRQQLYDDGEQPQQVLKAAARQGAYVVIGHMPVAFGKVPAGNYRVLLAGDPDMRRVYVAVEPGPHHPATTAQRERAHRLAEYLLGTEGQAALVAANRTIATPERPGPWVFPLPR